MLYDGLCKTPSAAEPGHYNSVDLVQNNLMDIFNCDPSWPICLYDFTIKQKCPTQFVFRTSHLLTSFVNPDYFYSQGSQQETQLATTNADIIIVERNFHLCQNLEFVKNFKLRFNCQDPELFDSGCLNVLSESEVQVTELTQSFVQNVAQPMMTLDFEPLQP